MNTCHAAFAGVVKMIEVAATVATNEAVRVAEDKRLKAVPDENRRQNDEPSGSPVKRATSCV
ncbi:MAG: hypothetical protein JWQ50_8134 [Caballeronia mineralivorans]|jgi:uncharacterized protein YpuA (DUF1002 family)|nr:hypothetical protein [Caballeronia mineralivorans]